MVAGVTPSSGASASPAWYGDPALLVLAYRDQTSRQALLVHNLADREARVRLVPARRRLIATSGPRPVARARGQGDGRAGHEGDLTLEPFGYRWLLDERP